jgi:hydroxyacylglutathione hydrolase
MNGPKPGTGQPIEEAADTMTTALRKTDHAARADAEPGLAPSPHPRVSPIPAFTDNYIWCLDNGDGSVLVVDPGDAEPVQALLADRGLRLAGILITHHHYDHVGGVAALKADHACPVYGPRNPAIASIDHALDDGDHVDIGAFSFEIMTVPGHTLDHIAYFDGGQDPPLLFCGDTLFAAGCGRLFEGTPATMAQSLERLAALPMHTAVYCTHEYTLANLGFAQAAEPHNELLRARVEVARSLRDADVPTLPSTIALECATNPFLRCAEESIRETLELSGRASRLADPVDAFAALRAWKDDF